MQLLWSYPFFLFNLEKKKVEKKDKITIYEYVASSSPAEAHFLINKFGKYRKARDERELAYQLRDFVRSFGENGLMELAKIHPDRELIEIDCKGCAEAKAKESEKSNFIQQPQPAQPIHYNASGEDGAEKRIEGKLIILGAFLLMGVALLMRNK